MFGIIIKTIEVLYNFYDFLFSQDSRLKKKIYFNKQPRKQVESPLLKQESSSSFFILALIFLFVAMIIVYCYPVFTTILFFLTLIFTFLKIVIFHIFELPTSFTRIYAIRSFIYSSFSLLNIVRPAHIQVFYDSMTGFDAKSINLGTMFLWLISNCKQLFLISFDDRSLFFFILLFALIRILIAFSIIKDIFDLLFPKNLAVQVNKIKKNKVMEACYLIYLIIIALIASNYDFIHHYIDLLPQ